MVARTGRVLDVDRLAYDYAKRVSDYDILIWAKSNLTDAQIVTRLSSDPARILPGMEPLNSLPDWAREYVLPQYRQCLLERIMEYRDTRQSVRSGLPK